MHGGIDSDRDDDGDSAGANAIGEAAVSWGDRGRNRGMMLRGGGYSTNPDGPYRSWRDHYMSEVERVYQRL